MTRLEKCPHCQPWTRVIANPATGLPVVQALHEPHCPIFPRLQRLGGELERDENQWTN